jgi:hypothetical protein
MMGQNDSQDRTKTRPKLHWLTRGVIFRNDKDPNNIRNLKVRIGEKHTGNYQEFYVIIEDLLELIHNGYVIHPINGKENFVRIKLPMTQDEMDKLREPIIKKKTDIFGKLTGGL